MSIDIFLSYSRNDTIPMNVIRDNLMQLGFNVWIDEDDLTVGTPEWEVAIERAIEGADAFVVLLSANSKRSRWVKIEIRWAEMRGIPIFPVLLDEENESIPFRLAGMQFADLRGRSDYEAGFRKLINGIAARFGLVIEDFEMRLTSHSPKVVIHGGVNQFVSVAGDVSGNLNVAGENITISNTEVPNVNVDKEIAELEQLQTEQNWHSILEQSTRLLNLSIAQQNQKLHFVRGLAQYHQGKPQQAIEDFKQAIRIDPQYLDAYINLGNAFFEVGNYPSAIACYGQAIRIDPQDPNTHHIRANTYKKLEDFDLAIADYDTAINLEPDNPLYYANRGETYFKKGEYQQAIYDWDKALELEYFDDERLRKKIARARNNI